MGLDKLQRVLWRVRERNPNVANPTNRELELAIMMEIGTDKQTYKRNRKSLMKLGYIERYTKQRFKLTNKDLSDG